MESGAGVAQGWLRQPPARALVAASAISVQFGAALATHLFNRIGPTGAVTLRLAVAGAVLAVVIGVGRGGWRGYRSITRADLVVAVAFGLVLAAMNLSFYEAISRIPLGVAVTVEFAGPLAVTLCASRRRSDLLWAVLAAGGVFLLAGRIGHHLDPVGVGLALLAGGFWAAYILLSGETGRRFTGATGLTLAMMVSAGAGTGRRGSRALLGVAVLPGTGGAAPVVAPRLRDFDERRPGGRRGGRAACAGPAPVAE
jgi:inner membrane transporter RhtA